MRELTSSIGFRAGLVIGCVLSGFVLIRNYVMTQLYALDPYRLMTFTSLFAVAVLVLLPLLGYVYERYFYGWFLEKFGLGFRISALLYWMLTFPLVRVLYDVLVLYLGQGYWVYGAPLVFVVLYVVHIIIYGGIIAIFYTLLYHYFLRKRAGGEV